MVHRGNHSDHPADDGGLKFVARSGAWINANTRDCLLRVEDYQVVRDFKNAATVYARVTWDGDPSGPFAVSAVGIPPLKFGSEEEANNFYEDTLASLGCGEWVSKEDGTNYFLETFNDSPHAGKFQIVDQLRMSWCIEIEQAYAAPSSELYGTW